MHNFGSEKLVELFFKCYGITDIDYSKNDFYFLLGWVPLKSDLPILLREDWSKMNFESTVLIRNISSVLRIIRSGYDWYHVDKNPRLVEAVEGYLNTSDSLGTSFFIKARTGSSAPYPCWPRAFAQEVAVFHICQEMWIYLDFDAYAQL